MGIDTGEPFWVALLFVFSSFANDSECILALIVSLVHYGDYNRAGGGATNHRSVAQNISLFLATRRKSHCQFFQRFSNELIF
jgi:hypothetical protein